MRTPRTVLAVVLSVVIGLWLAFTGLGGSVGFVVILIAVPTAICALLLRARPPNGIVPAVALSLVIEAAAVGVAALLSVGGG